MSQIDASLNAFSKKCSSDSYESRFGFADLFRMSFTACLHNAGYVFPLFFNWALLKVWVVCPGVPCFMKTK